MNQAPGAAATAPGRPAQAPTAATPERAPSAATAGALAADPPPPPAEPLRGPALRIVAPRAGEIVSGRLPIEVALALPAEAAEAAGVEIQVDGAVVARLDRAPYTTTFDFGSALAARTITARVISGPGTGLKAGITTRGLKIDQVTRVDLVTLFVSVRSGSGKYVSSLDKGQFRVWDSGRNQSISHFEIERRPLAAAILLDTSFSMGGERIAAAREAATRFIKTLAPEDRVMVVTFNDRPEVLSDLTAQHETAIAALASAQARGGTALYDAIYTVSDRLSREEGRKVIVLLSDGRDEAQNGIEPGSLHTSDEALEKALRSEVILFTIGFGKKLAEEMDFYGRTSLKEILDRLAIDSGGSAHYPTRTSQLKAAYELIGEELRNQYSLAYAPDMLRLDGSWHPIRVDLIDQTLKALTRRGYYAPKG